MANRSVQLRRGTTAEHSTFTGLLGELTIDTSKNTGVVHDGATAGGFPLALDADLQTHINDTSNPHSVTRAQLNLATTDAPAFAGATFNGLVSLISANLNVDGTVAATTDVTIGGWSALTVDDLSSNGGAGGFVAETAGGGFPNVNGNVSATDEELNTLVGHPNAMDTILDNFLQARLTLPDGAVGGMFDSNMSITVVRIGNVVTITADQGITHAQHYNPSTSTGFIPSWARPTTNIENVTITAVPFIMEVEISADGTFDLYYRDYSGADYSTSGFAASGTISITYVVTGDVQ